MDSLVLSSSSLLSQVVSLVLCFAVVAGHRKYEAEHFFG